MSQSHIPQPDAGTAAEVFDSVSDVATTPVVSGLGQPAGPPGEIPVHTGQQNSFDPQIHRQWVPTDTIIWSVTQPSSTLMWYKPVHPTFSNPLLAYQSGIYNTWGGSIDYRWKVAGTGFHAGAIAIVRLPPNCHPKEFASPSQWGAFEYLVIDPKTLETESVGVSDQRPIAFHYFPFKEDNPLTFGGWIAMFVLIPLNTSATGSQQIAIQAFSRPGMSFQFSQLIMPSVTRHNDPFPKEYTEIFDFHDSETMTTVPYVSNMIALEPDSVTQTDWVSNCYDIYGKKLSKYTSSWKGLTSDPADFELSGQFKVFAQNVGANFQTVFLEGQIPQCIPKDKTPVSVLTAQAGESWDSSTFTYTLGTSEICHWNFSSLATSITELKSGFAICHEPAVSPAFKDNTYSSVVSGESIIHFLIGKNNRTIKSVQTRRMTQLFKSGALQDSFYSGVSALFTIVSKDENVPIGYAKLYAEGFFTTKAGKDQTLLNTNNVKFLFQGFISRTDPIPPNREFAKNMMLYRAIHRL